MNILSVDYEYLNTDLSALFYWISTTPQFYRKLFISKLSRKSLISQYFSGGSDTD